MKTPILQTAVDANDFDLAIQRTVADGSAATCVLYFSAHSISDRSNGYLLSRQATAQSETSWYPIDRLFTSLTAAVRAKDTVQNVVVVLDTNRMQRRFEIGLLSNNFNVFLKRHFASTWREWRNDEVLQDKHLAVLCATDADQVAWTSPTWKCSPFAGFVAYGLSGGADVDGLASSNRPARRADAIQRLMQTRGEYETGDVISVHASRPNGVPIETQFVFGEDGETVGDLMDTIQTAFLDDAVVFLDDAGNLLVDFGEDKPAAIPVLDVRVTKSLEASTDFSLPLTVAAEADEFRDDRIVSTEFTQFVRRSVTEWSLRNRARIQQPIVLQFGGPFHIRQIDSSVTMSSVLDPPSADEGRDGEEKVAEAKGGSTNAAAAGGNEDASEDDKSSEPAKAALTEDSSKEAAEDVEDQVTVDEVAGGGEGTTETPQSEEEAETKHREQAVSRLGMLWNRRHELSRQPRIFFQPGDWAELQTHLIAADLALANREYELAMSIADSIERRSLTVLGRTKHKVPRMQWSLAVLSPDWPEQPGSVDFVDLEEADDSESIQSSVVEVEDTESAFNRHRRLMVRYVDHELFPGAADQSTKSASEGEDGTDASGPPADDKDTSVEVRNTVEWALYRSFQTFEQSGGPTDLRTDRQAIATRALAELVTAPAYAAALELVREELVKADKAREDAQTNHLLGRPIKARSAYERAEMQYLQVQRSLDVALRAMHVVCSLTVELSLWVECVGQLPASHPRRHRVESNLRAFIFASQKFAQLPAMSRLMTAADLAREVRLSGSELAVSALNPPNYGDIKAALLLPQLTTDLRQRLVQAMADIDDSALISVRSDASTSHRTPAPSLFPLSEPIQLLSPADTALRDNTTFIRQLGFVDSPDAEVSDVLLAQYKAQLSESLREFFLRLRLNPLDDADGTTWWRRHLLSLATARWGGNGRHSASRDAYSKLLSRELNQRYLNWQFDRLEAENRTLPGDTYRSALSTLKTQLARFDQDRAPALRTHDYRFTSAESLSIDSGELAVTPLVVLRSSSSRNMKPSQLQVTSISTRGEIDFSVEETIDAEDFTAVLDPLVPERRWRIAVTADEPSDGVVTVRVTSQDGNVDWHRIRVTSEAPDEPIAELDVSWNDAGRTVGRIDLYPNQSLSLKLVVNINDEEDSQGLSLKVQGADGVQHDIPVKIEAGQKVVPVAPPPEFTIDVSKGALNFRLVKGDDLIDEVIVPVSILDMTQCFRRRVLYDALSQQVNVHIERVHSSDVESPIPFSLSVLADSFEDALTQDGDFEMVMQPDANSGEMNAVIPIGVSSPYHVAISANDVPRAFVYQMSRRQAIGKHVSDLHMRVNHKHVPKVVEYKSGPWGITLPLQIDGPEAVYVAAGLDLNRNGVLERQEQTSSLGTWFGRAVRLSLSGPPKAPEEDAPSPAPETKPPAPEWKLNAVVTDVSLPVDLTGRSGLRRVLVQAQSGTQTRTLPIDLAILKRAPNVRIESPAEGQRHGLNQPLTVTLEAPEGLFDTISKIELGFDLNGDGILGAPVSNEPTEEKKDDPAASELKREIVLPLGYPKGAIVRFNKSARLSLQLPTSVVPPGPATLMVRTYAKVRSDLDTGTSELTSDYFSRTIEISPVGEIEGRALFSDGTVAKGAIVQIGQLARTVADANGDFSFVNIPPGEHAVLAISGVRSARSTVVVRAGEAAKTELKLFVAN